MKLAHLLPVTLISATPESQTTHLTLTPLIIQYPKYCNWLRRKMLRGDTVILDNPIHENQPVNTDMWMTAIDLLHPTVTVIPDVIDDDEQTVHNAQKLASVVKRHWDGQLKLMAVPHGVSQEDFYACARALSRIPEIDYLGISLERRLKWDDEALLRRAQRVRYVASQESMDHLKIHLLGTSERGREFTGGDYWRRVASADSSKFAVFYLTGNPVVPPCPIDAPYPGRSPFGGSMEYFHARPLLPIFGKYRLTRNLAEWIEYAEKDERLWTTERTHWYCAEAGSTAS